MHVKQEMASQPLSKRHLRRGRLFLQSATAVGKVVKDEILVLASAPRSSSKETLLTEPCRTAISKGLTGSRLRLAPAFSSTSAVSVPPLATAK